MSSWASINDGKAIAETVKIEILGDEKKIEEWLGSDLSKVFDGVEIQWVDPTVNNGKTRLVAIHLATPNGAVHFD